MDAVERVKIDGILEIEVIDGNGMIKTDKIKYIGDKTHKSQTILLTWHGVKQEFVIPVNASLKSRIYKIDDFFVIIIFDAILYFKNEIRLLKMSYDIISCVPTNDFIYVITVLEVMKISKNTMELLETYQLVDAFRDYKVIKNNLIIELENGNQVELMGESL